MRDPVKASGEQMSEIVREHFVSFDSGVFTQGFHLCPDLLSFQPGPVFRQENLSPPNPVFGGVFAEFPAKLSRNKDRPQLAFHGNPGSPFFDRVGGDVWDFTDADPRGADGFHQ